MEILNSGYIKGDNLNEAHLPSVLARALAAIAQYHYTPETHEFDYQACANSKSYEHYLQVVSALQDFDPASLTDMDEKVAFWLNLYNGLVIHSVIHHEVCGSVRHHNGFYTYNCYKLKDHHYSLDDIEHGILRSNSPKFASFWRPLKKKHPGYQHALPELDARIHAALFCATISCPLLRIYDPEHLSKILDNTVSDYLLAYVSFHAGKQLLTLPKTFYWYRKDFGSDRELIAFVREKHPSSDVRLALAKAGENIKFDFRDFDWSLNATRYQWQQSEL
ncbi:glycoside hydrolase 15-related [Elysia marginata]|uniref:Glycoside hydrolase 15-related n=1 Tax=Elysia marginata TaxID=1093978 RepID=A0AAV4I7A2_9GAST|nr:glycoside hydrolase 15-related [Elysia marginata]